MGIYIETFADTDEQSIKSDMEWFMNNPDLNVISVSLSHFPAYAGNPGTSISYMGQVTYQSVDRVGKRVFYDGYEKYTTAVKPESEL